jgi:hypothetical protein
MEMGFENIAMLGFDTGVSVCLRMRPKLSSCKHLCYAFNFPPPPEAGYLHYNIMTLLSKTMPIFSSLRAATCCVSCTLSTFTTVDTKNAYKNMQV